MGVVYKIEDPRLERSVAIEFLPLAYLELYDFHILARLRGGRMRELVESIAKALVDKPEEVHVTVVEGKQTTVFELRVAKSDMGMVIGKQGRTAGAIRTILGAAGMKFRKSFLLEILE